MFLNFTVTVFASSKYTGRVLEVLDGDSLKLKLQNDEIVYVKLIGIDAQGYDLAYKYLTNNMLGKTISIGYDNNFNNNFNRWQYVYAYDGDIFINKALLEKGYAKLSGSNYASLFSDNFADLSSFAQNKDLGIWASKKETYRININTASSFVLQNYLNGIDENLAINIMRDRKHYHFENVDELLNVTDMTEDIYYANLFNVTTKTNINEATFEELLSLSDISSDEVKAITTYREQNLFDDITVLYKKHIIDKTTYDKIKDYIYI